jgi:hypothetical protein
MRRYHERTPRLICHAARDHGPVMAVRSGTPAAAGLGRRVEEALEPSVVAEQYAMQIATPTYF